MCVTERERRGKVNLSFLFIQNILYGHKDVNKRFTLPLLSLSLSIYDSLRERGEGR